MLPYCWTIVYFTCLVVLYPTFVITSQSVDVAAKLARRVLSDAGRGHIITLMDGSVSEDFGGFPFGIMEYYSEKCMPNGNLLLFMSNMQLSARNMHKNMNKVAYTITAMKEYNRSWNNHSTPVEQPRFTLFGKLTEIPTSETDSAMDCFSQTHPEANTWRQFHDFNFYEFHVQGVYYIGGFGGLNYIGWIPVDLYQRAALHEASMIQQA